MPLESFPIWIQKQYNLKMLAYKRFVHLELQRAVWGLPQAGILASKCLQCKLTPFQYLRHVSTPGLWYHKTWPISFTLVVDDFRVKNMNQEDVHHFQFQTLWTLEFSSELYFSNHKMYSRQFGTCSPQFKILSRHRFFKFHELENVPAIHVSGKWHQISRLNAPTLFARTIAITLLTISTQYTQIYENLIDISRYWHCCWSTNTGKNGWWWQRSHWLSIWLQLGIQDRSTPCSWFHLGLSRYYPWHYSCRWWW